MFTPDVELTPDEQLQASASVMGPSVAPSQVNAVAWLQVFSVVLANGEASADGGWRDVHTWRRAYA